VSVGGKTNIPVTLIEDG